MRSLGDWIKESADGRAVTTVDNQEAWAGAYEGKFEVERSENMFSGHPHLDVSDKDATDEQLEARDLMDQSLDDVDDK